MANQINLNDAGIKFMRTIVRCGEWHIRTSHKVAPVASDLSRMGLVHIAHTYRRMGAFVAVYKPTTLGLQTVAAIAA
jgi:hypothetical protein